MANIVVCCDGTWNTLDERDGGVPCPTNVVKIYNAIADTDSTGTKQKRYYHSGVERKEAYWAGHRRSCR